MRSGVKPEDVPHVIIKGLYEAWQSVNGIPVLLEVFLQSCESVFRLAVCFLCWGVRIYQKNAISVESEKRENTSTQK